MLEVHTRVHGPIFDGRALVALDDYAQAVVDDVAAQGYQDVRLTLHRVLKHPTGYYESQIRDRPIGALTHVLYDNRVIYGAWLEGVGSRNAPVTRFEGYFTFRRVAQHLDRKAKPIAERTLHRYIGRMR